MEKEETSATIAELVAKTEQQGRRFFKSADEKNDVQASIHQTDSPQPPQAPVKSDIEERLLKTHSLIQCSSEQNYRISGSLFT